VQLLLDAALGVGVVAGLVHLAQHLVLGRGAVADVL
jgi:hypothetical protein